MELQGFTDLKSENQIHFRVLIRILEISPFSIILVFISADLSTLSWIMPKASRDIREKSCPIIFLGSTEVLDRQGSISNVIWVLSYDTFCQLNQLFSNSEAAMLSKRG